MRVMSHTRTLKARGAPLAALLLFTCAPSFAQTPRELFAEWKRQRVTSLDPALETRFPPDAVFRGGTWVRRGELPVR